MTLTKDLEEELSASLGERCITKFIDDKELDSGELGLELEQTPLIARFHQLMNGAGRRNESNRETALTGREAERQAGMRLAGPARDSDIMPGIRLPRIGSFIHFIRSAARRSPSFARIAFKARTFSSCCSPTGPWRIYPAG